MIKNSPSELKWKEVLRLHGFRSTSAIIATLECLENSMEALSHDDLTQNLGDLAPDRVTLYRILDRLTQAKIVQRFTDISRTHHYSLRSSAALGSFECDRCHHVIPLETNPELEQALQVVKRLLSHQGLSERHSTLASYGLCADCSTSGKM